ncbi:ribonuclease III domain-containing protein [Thermoproteota archaeon]
MDLDKVQRDLGVEFEYPGLLLEALTHSSCLNEPQMGLTKHNESTSWLGDALLNWIVSEYVYRDRFSTEELHNLRAHLIDEEYLSERAVHYCLDKALRMTGGEEKQGGRTNQTNLHTAYEAIVGAIYRDKGYEHAKRFILKNCV